MRAEAERFQREIPAWFLPGALYTFVGAGGKSTAMRRVASLLAGRGMRVRMTTTTRVGVGEFAGFPLALVRGPKEVQRAVDRSEPVILMAAGIQADQDKYTGVDPALLDGVRLRADLVLLVEGDGSRRLPVKVPGEREPVIPACSRAVMAFLGAAAIDEPIDERHCHHHQEALTLLGRTGSFLEAEEIALLASHHHGSRKGVLPGMAFRFVINQGDLAEKRETAVSALRLAKERSGVDGILASFKEGEIYETTSD